MAVPLLTDVPPHRCLRSSVYAVASPPALAEDEVSEPVLYTHALAQPGTAASVLKTLTQKRPVE